MANVFTFDLGKVLEMGIPVLRNTSAVLRSVGRDYSGDTVRGKSDTINIPVQNDFSTTDVVAGYTHNNTGVSDIDPTNKQLVFNQHKKSFFVVTDKDLHSIQNNVLPRAAGAAIASLVNEMGDYVLDVAKKGIGQSTGAAGTPLFATVQSATDAYQKLFDAKTPFNGEEFMLLGGVAQNAALQLGTFHEANKSGSLDGLERADLGTKFGFQIYGDQQIAEHTAGAIVDNPVVTGVEAVGSTVIGITCDAGDTVDLLAGDLVTFGGSRTYAVTADVSIANSATGDVLISEGLEVALAGTEALAVIADHTNNYAWNRECIQFASAPLANVVPAGANISVITDPVSGISMMLEVTRVNAQTIWTFSTLYGASVIVPAYGDRMIA